MKHINPKELKIFLEKKIRHIDLIDIRSVFEYKECHLLGAISLPIDNLKFINHHSSKTIAVFYCKTSKRTSDDADELEELGYLENYILSGGINSWRRVLLPLCAEPKNCKCGMLCSA